MTNKSKKLSKEGAPSTRRESRDALLGENNSEEIKKGAKIPFIKNVGFINEKWTEILVEEESEEIDRHEIKKAIIQMIKR